MKELTMIPQAKRTLLKRVIYGTLMLAIPAGCFFILFIVLLFILNSYHRDTVQEVSSPDGQSVLIVELDSEDDPYYVFKLNKKTFPGGAKYLGACQLQWKGPDYSVSKWEDNRRFLLQIKQDNKLVKAVSIDTEHPVFPCLAPGESIDSVRKYHVK